jgi:hypothetical protein
MTKTTFYIPIASGSLAHYFSRAIILPARYLRNKIDDIQNRLPDSVLLSKAKWVDDADTAIEVVLTNKEINGLSQVSEDLFLSSAPIPISRVRSIFFSDQKQKETVIWNINSGAAFIPEAIVSVEDIKDAELVSSNDITAANELKSTSDVSDKVKRFDRILGGFAFMRLGGRTFMNYSWNYFSTLSHFNKLIEEQTLCAEKEKGFAFSDKYIGLFTKHESEWSRWQKYIHTDLDSEALLALAEKEGVRVERKLGVLNLSSIDRTSHLYELAILATYGDRKTKSTDDLVTDLTNETIPHDKAEDVAILFGLNNGYSRLRNKYQRSGKDSNVKFTLDSKLDYYTIESVYQFVFNSPKPSYSFDYIDEWCPSIKSKEKAKGYDTYMILDSVIIAKKKKTSLALFLDSYSAEIYSQIVRSIDKLLPPFVEIDNEAAEQFYKELLRGALSASALALKKNIEAECEANFESQLQEREDSHKRELSKLNDEISKLRTQAGVSLGDGQSGKQSQTGADTKKSIVPEHGLGRPPETTEGECDYASCNITTLKKIAKKKGIAASSLKNFKKGHEAELRSLILNAVNSPPLL